MILLFLLVSVQQTFFYYEQILEPVLSVETYYEQILEKSVF